MTGAQETSFVAGARRLDARLHAPAGPPKGSIVLSHPHPMHGGDMDHPVVVLAAQRAAAAGLAALRFDFGGVRGSEGDVGDRAAHLEEARAALRHVATRAPGLPAWAGGFSYGARAWLRLAAGPAARDVAGLLLLAPATRVPRTARDFGNLLLGRPLADGGPDEQVLGDLRALALPAEVVVGERDVVSPPAEIRGALPSGATLTVLPGLNHFFSRTVGAGETARDLLAPALDAALGRLTRSSRP